MLTLDDNCWMILEADDMGLVILHQVYHHYILCILNVQAWETAGTGLNA